jgi:hypothetical protein
VGADGVNSSNTEELSDRRTQVLIQVEPHEDLTESEGCWRSSSSGVQRSLRAMA